MYKDGHFNAALVCSTKHVPKALMVSIWMIWPLVEHKKGGKTKIRVKVIHLLKIKYPLRNLNY